MYRFGRQARFSFFAGEGSPLGFLKNGRFFFGSSSFALSNDVMNYG